MSVRDELPPVLRGDAAAELDPKSRSQLDALAAAAQSEGLVVLVRDECAARLRQAGASAGVEYLLARACLLHGERERALQTLLTLGDRLALAKRWEPLAAVADAALEIEETAAGAHLLIKAHEGLKKEPARIDALQRAWAILPDDLELGLLLAVRLGDAGQAEERRAMLGELAPRFAAEGRYAGLEEAALEVVEHQDHEGLASVIGVLPEVVTQGAAKEAKQLLDVAFATLAAGGQAGSVEKALRDVVSRSGEGAAEPFRQALVESIRQGSGARLPDVAQVLAVSGLADRLQPLVPALERFDAVAALAPGRAVLHGSFGAGRVVKNDGENVIIDFTRSPSHRMPYAAARRSLTPLEEDDLRLMRFTNPAALEKLRKEDPGGFLVRALQALNGEADAQKLKLFVVGHGLVPANEWTVTFRKLKAAAEKDPRIDHARAFEQVYRIAPGGSLPAAEDAPLPALEPRKAVKSNLNTMRKFLSQHPLAEPALAQRFGRYLERALADPEGDVVDRARAGLYVARWTPDRAHEWPRILLSLWEQGLRVSDLSGEEEQLALLEVSHAAGVEADAILSGLDSRFSSVRERAAEARDRLDTSGRALLRRTLLDHAPRYPQAALRLIETELASPPGEGDAANEESWRLLWSALALLEEKPKPSTADTVLEWIAENGPFERRLRARVCPEPMRLRLAVLLRQWRSSDRYLFPGLELAGRIGLAEAVESVQNAREESARKMFAGVGQQAEVDLPVMTRATFERLRRDLEKMERELRTELPKTIQKARELGDLRENAEYHSAKLKQANLSKQVAALQMRLMRARFVEDVELPAGVIGPGTEVTLESERGTTTYWILGEDEHHHGAHVVSFQAPVGRALGGKTTGDEVTIDGIQHRVVSVERKLPAVEEETPRT